MFPSIIFPNVKSLKKLKPLNRKSYKPVERYPHLVTKFCQLARFLAANFTTAHGYCGITHIHQLVSPNVVTSLTLDINLNAYGEISQKVDVFARQGVICAACIDHTLSQPSWPHLEHLTLVINTKHVDERIFERLKPRQGPEGAMEMFPKLQTLSLQFSTCVEGFVFAAVKNYVPRIQNSSEHMRNVIINISSLHFNDFSQLLVRLFPLTDYKSIVDLCHRKLQCDLRTLRFDKRTPWDIFFRFAPHQMSLEACESIYLHFYDGKNRLEQLNALLSVTGSLQKDAWKTRPHWNSVVFWLCKRVDRLLDLEDLNKVMAWSQLRQFMILCDISAFPLLQAASSIVDRLLEKLKMLLFAFQREYPQQFPVFISQADHVLIRRFVHHYDLSTKQSSNQVDWPWKY